MDTTQFSCPLPETTLSILPGIEVVSKSGTFALSWECHQEAVRGKNVHSWGTQLAETLMGDLFWHIPESEERRARMARPWLADSWISRTRESGLHPPPPLVCSLVLSKLFNPFDSFVSSSLNGLDNSRHDRVVMRIEWAHGCEMFITLPGPV